MNNGLIVFKEKLIGHPWKFDQEQGAFNVYLKWQTFF